MDIKDQIQSRIDKGTIRMLWEYSTEHSKVYHIIWNHNEVSRSWLFFNKISQGDIDRIVEAINEKV